MPALRSLGAAATQEPDFKISTKPLNVSSCGTLRCAAGERDLFGLGGAALAMLQIDGVNEDIVVGDIIG